jgi:hypothetical protein
MCVFAIILNSHTFGSIIYHFWAQKITYCHPFWFSSDFNAQDGCRTQPLLPAMRLSVWIAFGRWRRDCWLSWDLLSWDSISLITMVNYSNICPTSCNVTQFILSGTCSTSFEWYYNTSSRAQQLYLQHLVFVTPLLLSAAIVEELELVWVCFFSDFDTQGGRRTHPLLPAMWLSVWVAFGRRRRANAD